MDKPDLVAAVQAAISEYDIDPIPFTDELMKAFAAITRAGCCDDPDALDSVPHEVLVRSIILSFACGWSARGAMEAEPVLRQLMKDDQQP